MSQQRGSTSSPYYTPPTQQQQAKPGVSTAPQPASPVPPSSSTTALWPSSPVFSFIRRSLQQACRTLKGQFTVVAAVALLLSLGISLFSAQSFSHASDDLDTIAYGSIPSVDYAQAIAQYMDDIDAKAADFLGTASLNDTPVPCSVPSVSEKPGVLEESVSAGNLPVYQCDEKTIDAKLLLANHQLFHSAHNVTYPGEQTAVERITEGLHEYNGYLAVMMHEFSLAANKGDANDPHMQAAYQAYQNASNILNKRIERQPLNANGSFMYSEPADAVPTCTVNGQTLQPAQWAEGSLGTNIDCLSAINHLHLDQAYDDTSSFLGVTIAVFAIVFVIFCLFLLFATLRMTAMTHRVINPGLTLALVVSIGFCIAVGSVFVSLSGDHGAYGQMVKDDYQSVYAADLLNRYGTNANADESRWLIALRFNDAEQVQHWADDWTVNVNKVRQSIQEAQNNQTWPEEIQPLSDMQTNWNDYFSLDSQIRDTAQNESDSHRLQNAELISTGRSNAAFGKFTDAVNQLRQANYDHFHTTLRATQDALDHFMKLCWVLFPLIGLSAVWGVYQRRGDF